MDEAEDAAHRAAERRLLLAKRDLLRPDLLHKRPLDKPPRDRLLQHRRRRPLLRLRKPSMSSL